MVRAFWWTTLVVASTAAFNGQEKVPGSVPKSATVHLQAVSISGVDLGDVKVELFEPIATVYGAPTKNFAGRFRGNTAFQIPTGLYRLRAYKPGFYSSERYVRVYQPEIWVIVGLEFGSEATTVAQKLTGKVNHKGDSSEPIWVKLVGVYLDTSIEAKVEPTGEFSMAGMPDGKYILLTIQGKQVLDTRAVEVPAKPVLIEIPQNVAGLALKR
jgi:hypothetical protein